MLKDYAGRSMQTAVALVNTYDIATGEDTMGDHDQAAQLLRDLQWEGVATLTQADLAHLVKLRHQLRVVFETSDEKKAVELLNQNLQATGAAPWLTDHDGHWHWHYARPGAPLHQRVTATTTVAMLSAIADGALSRMRVCEGHGCHRVFIDMSRPGTRRFCEPRGCANRAHVQAYRSRVRAGADPSPSK
jgi:predicted RNA-binding Zn ribbon-like protein